MDCGRSWIFCYQQFRWNDRRIWSPAIVEGFGDKSVHTNEVFARFLQESNKSSAHLLQREIPMARGTTTDSLTPEINPFQYAIEIKCLTLKDQTSYFIPDG